MSVVRSTFAMSLRIFR